MTARVAVAIIHGMGNQEQDFHLPLVEDITRKLKQQHIDPDDFAFRPIWWARIMAAKEEWLIEALKKNNNLDWMRLRKFVVQALADAIAYQKTYRSTASPTHETPIYELVHQLIGHEVHRLSTMVQHPAPFVVIGHSLGCHMMSNYIWDTQHGNLDYVTDKNNPFERLETLSFLATFGCNIPLFVLANNALEPIQFPPPSASNVFPNKPDGAIRAATQWLNFYDPDDVLGWPLKGLSPNYEQTVRRDIAVNAGNLLTSWNPASHSGYWHDNDVTGPIADGLAQIRALLP